MWILFLGSSRALFYHHFIHTHQSTLLCGESGATVWFKQTAQSPCLKNIYHEGSARSRGYPPLESLKNTPKISKSHYESSGETFLY